MCLFVAAIFVDDQSGKGKYLIIKRTISFTSIVGPNGSGKSNVIDAMLFVFGYRSKRLRSKKVSSLIHNSEKYPNVQSCTVSVHFQKIIDVPGDDYEVVPDSKFVVSRTARKDGSSDYYVNKKKTNFKEVGQMLRTFGIDLDHNRFLILQGEVEQISLMKPKAETEHDEGMLEYLEDIIGSSKYKEPIEQIAKSVEELNEARGEKLNRVKAVEKEKDELEGSKNEAVEFLTMENEITKRRHILFQKYIYECNQNEDKGKSKREEVQKVLDGIQNQLKEVSVYCNQWSSSLQVNFIMWSFRPEHKIIERMHQLMFDDEVGYKGSPAPSPGKLFRWRKSACLAENSEKKKEIGKEQKKITKSYEKLSKDAEEKKKAFAEIERTDFKLREDLKHRKQNSKKLKKSFEKEKEKLAEALAVPDKSKADFEKFTAAKVELESQKKAEEDKLNEIMAGLKDETEGLQAEKEVKEKELMERQKVVNEAKSKLDVAKSELEIYLSQHEGLKKQLIDSRKNLEKATSSIRGGDSLIKALGGEVPKLEQELKTSEEKLKVVVKEEEALSVKVRSSRTKVEEARSSLQSSKSRSTVLSSLMNEKKGGRLPGIYGRLGDLGAIDEKYDVAISTACGPLDFVVVDTMETATKCVEFLKKNNVGSTTFIALDKVEAWRSRATSKITTPEDVPRLFDLVRVNDDKLLTAFYFALQDTLVADSLKQATKIAYGKGSKRWRVVTVKGELIESSGTMSGGGTKVAQGRMGCKVMSDVSAKQVEKMESELEKLLEQLETLREEKRSLEKEMETLKKQVAAKGHQLEKASMEKQALIEQEKELRERVKTLEDQLKKATPDPEQTKKLEATVGKFEKEHRKAADSAAEIEKDVQKLHKKIMDIGGSKLRGQQMKLESVNKLIDEVTQNITKSNVAMKTAQRNIKKAEEKVQSLEKEIEENDTTIQSLEAEFQKLDEEATKVLEEHQEAEQKMKEVEQELEKVKKEYGGLEENENKLRSEEIDVKHEFEKYETVVKENHQKVKHWQKELGKLSLHQVDSGAENQEELSLTSISDEELEKVDKEAIMYEITVQEEKLSQMKPNMAAINEYRKKEEAYLQKVAELDKVTEERDGKRREHEALRKERLDMFMAGFSIITTKLKEMYQMITLGGDAELELVDSLDPFSEGIVFSVRPPKKSWKEISNLSGGEKTLSSLALVFALHHFKPTPLYVMDEIDAALDFKNVSIVANYIKERTKNAQFIIISLRNNMFELADRLVGIYKTDNCTKSVVVNPQLIAAQS